MGRGGGVGCGGSRGEKTKTVTPFTVIPPVRLKQRQVARLWLDGSFVTGEESLAVIIRIWKTVVFKLLIYLFIALTEKGVQMLFLPLFQSSQWSELNCMCVLKAADWCGDCDDLGTVYNEGFPLALCG